MTEHIFTGILESYKKEEISIEKAKRSIRLLLDGDNTSDEVVKKFNICAVGNHRELLIAYDKKCEHYHIEDIRLTSEQLVDRFLSNL
jgi:hypothetical protein